jgi:DNA-binding PadR family transcriptional regulator
MDRELKKGSTELLILSLLDARPRHGYDIGRQIEQRSNGRGAAPRRVPLSAALPPREARLGGRTMGREDPANGRRRYYRLTPAGRKMLADHKDTWRAFVSAVNRVVRTSNA